MKRLWALALLFLFVPRAWAAEAPDSAEPGVVDIPAVPADRQEAEWKGVEDARGGTGFARALEAWLLTHPHGQAAARALIEKAALQENLLEAAALLRSARGEASGTALGSRATLDLARLEYAQDRAESALLLLDDADAWPRSEDVEPDWLYWRGQCRLALKGFERARKDLEQFAAAYPKHPKAAQAQLGVVECDAALKQDAAALEGFARIYKDPRAEYGAQALWGAAMIHQRRGEAGDAKQLFERVRAQYPASFEAYAAKDHLAQLAAAPPPKPRPTPKAVPKPSRFFVHVGAFAKKAAAQKLQRTLKARHYSVLLVNRPWGSRTLYLVKTGPYRNRAAAEAVARKLSTHEKMSQQQIVQE